MERTNGKQAKSERNVPPAIGPSVIEPTGGGIGRLTSGDGAWEAGPPAQSNGGLSQIPKERTKQGVLYCGKRFCLSSLLLHKHIDNSSVMDDTNAVRRKFAHARPQLVATPRNPSNRNWR